MKVVVRSDGFEGYAKRAVERSKRVANGNGSNPKLLSRLKTHWQWRKH